jgi:histidine ammonia-lyase
MTVVISGGDLTREQVVRVARGHEDVALDPTAVERMRATRQIVESALARGDVVYGLNTGVGVLKRVGLTSDESETFSRRLIRHHALAQGPTAPVDVVRATMLRMANGFAGGTAGVGPSIAERVVSALNDGREPRVRILGSLGQSDLASLADIAADLFEDLALAPGEGLALINSNSFSTGWAALAVTDASDLVASMEAVGALSLEAIAANNTMLHPAIAKVRPFPGLKRSLPRLRDLLDGSFIWRADAARNLQDPLTFRNLPQLQGACWEALDQAEGQLAVELNGSQGNPIVVLEENRVISVGNFEILPLAAALDLLRIVLASALTSSSERAVKLLETPWSGLPTGLVPTGGTPDPGLSFLGIVSQALAGEARLLAQPVSFEMASSAHAEGIEDRMTMAPLGARRLAEMVEMGQRIVAGELVVAAQAAELRGLSPLGRGTGKVMLALRERVPFLQSGDELPGDLEPVRDLVRSGELGRTSAA